MANATYKVQGSDAANEASTAKVDMKFEIVVIPVSDVDRGKEFYARLGWRLDADYDNGKDFRVIQFIMSNTALTGATYDIDGGQQLVAD